MAMTAHDPPVIQRRWIALSFLAAMYTLHTVDRNVISVVLEPIRHEFNLSDHALGALGGLAHAIAYAVCVLPVSWLVDRTNRVRLLTVLLATWSGLTLVCAFASGYWSLFLARMGVGAAESGSAPAAHSLIANLFPVRERATAMGILFASTAIGTGLIFLIGGHVAHEFGWRMVFLVAGVPGLLLALAMWLWLAEPKRNEQELGREARPGGLLTVARVFFSTPAILFTVGGLTIAAMTVGSIWAWIAPYLIRNHGISLATAGLIVGISAGVVKALSTALAGFVADRIARGQVSRLWIVPSCALACSFPIAVAMMLTTSDMVAMCLVLALGLSVGTHYGPAKSVLMTLVPDRMRGQISGLTELSTNLLGVGIGPLVTGAISDALGGGKAIGAALAGTLALNLVAALFFWLGARTLPARAVLQPPLTARAS